MAESDKGAIPPITAPLGEWARWYAKTFRWPIFPVRPRSKEPATIHGVKDASINSTSIWEWWHQYPDANIGLATGKLARVFVVDIDKHDGRNGFETLAALEFANGPLATSFAQLTGGGGKQLFLAMPLDGTDIRNSAGKLGPGIDVRGSGGYVLLPPSIHPNGKTYAWESPPRLPAPNPTAWLLDHLIRPKADDHDEPEPPFGAEMTAEQLSRYVEVAIRREIAAVEHAPEGQRNHRLNQAGFSLGQFAAAGLISEDDIRGHLTPAALKAGLPIDEIIRTLNSALTASADKPRAAPTASVVPFRLKSSKTSAAVPPIEKANGHLNGHAIEDTPAPSPPPPPPQPKPRKKKEADDDQSWRDGLTTTDRGPHSNLCNASIIIPHLPGFHVGMFRYDIFANRAIITRPTPWDALDEEPWTNDPAEQERAWTGKDDIALCNLLQKHELPNIKTFIVAEAVELLASRQPFHPVRDYLSGLTWDGKPRLDTWMINYLGAPASKYCQAVAARWMIAAVARVMQPGILAKYTLVLEGSQDTLKSTALRTLAPRFFTDEVGDFGTKDAAMQLCGRWIIELAELDHMTRSQISTIKAFLARSVDWYRPPYGRRTMEFPRQCIFAGTINPGGSGYLRDDTGNVRFWPIRCGKINITALAEIRDALWAEARDRYLAGEAWWIDTPQLTVAAHQEQEERFESDVWEPAIAEYIKPLDDTSVQEVLKNALNLSMDKWDTRQQRRVAAVLHHLKWDKYRATAGKERPWRYRPRIIPPPS